MINVTDDIKSRIKEGSTSNFELDGNLYGLDHIACSNQEVFDESGSVVMIETYQAHSEHGSFQWRVAARCSEFDSSREIESTDMLTQPNGCEANLPVFSIYNSFEHIILLKH